METTKRYYLFLLTTVVLYFSASKYVFDKVYDTTNTVIDELFHIPQGLAYCSKNFTHWDPKITTLPGLYLVSSAFLGNYFDCNLYNLRFINLIASCLNLLLFSSILKYVYSTVDSQLKIVLQALNLTILPPLYFFSHVYYTDTLSVMFLLAFSRLCFQNKHKFLIFVLGFCSVMMRQTNIVWIAMVFGHKALDLLIRTSRVFGNRYIGSLTLRKNSLLAKDLDKSKLRRYYGIKDAFVALRYHITTYFTTFFNYLTLQDFLTLFIHALLLLLFSVFVYVNGSIVVGDKKAHEVTIHVPQLFYFLIFYGVFGLPYVLAKIPSTLKLILNNKMFCVFLGLLFVVIVHFNTIVHPYLLADNRHYTFYVWNRWYGKYEFAIYATVPIYLFLYVSLYDNLKDQNCVSFLLPYSICAFTVLSLQKMIEIRYFLVPYIILRLRFVRPSYKVVLFEFVWYIFLNCITFYLFFTKQVFWKDFDYAQRLIW